MVDHWKAVFCCEPVSYGVCQNAPILNVKSWCLLFCVLCVVLGTVGPGSVRQWSEERQRDTERHSPVSEIHRKPCKQLILIQKWLWSELGFKCDLFLSLLHPPPFRISLLVPMGDQKETERYALPQSTNVPNRTGEMSVWCVCGFLCVSVWVHVWMFVWNLAR